MEGQIADNTIVEPNVFYYFCRRHFNLTLNVLNNTMKMQKTLIFQHFSISPIHFNVKNKTKWRIQGELMVSTCRVYLCTII